MLRASAALIALAACALCVAGEPIPPDERSARQLEAADEAPLTEEEVAKLKPLIRSILARKTTAELLVLGGMDWMDEEVIEELDAAQEFADGGAFVAWCGAHGRDASSSGGAHLLTPDELAQACKERSAAGAPEPEVRSVSLSALAAASPSTIVTVPVAFHVFNNLASTADCLLGLRRMNENYAGMQTRLGLVGSRSAPHGERPETGVRFELVGIHQHTDDARADCGREGRTFQRSIAYAEEYGADPWQVVNVFVCTNEYAGYAYLPSYPSWTKGLNAFMNPSYITAQTLSHELGHGLGLAHTFSGGCSADNDGVDDTPAMSDASHWQGCLARGRGPPSPSDTCPGMPGADAADNIMSYNYQNCRQRFTPGQAARIAAKSGYGRPRIFSPSAERLKFKVVGAGRCTQPTATLGSDDTLDACLGRALSKFPSQPALAVSHQWRTHECRVFGAHECDDPAGLAEAGSQWATYVLRAGGPEDRSGAWVASRGSSAALSLAQQHAPVGGSLSVSVSDDLYLTSDDNWLALLPAGTDLGGAPTPAAELKIGDALGSAQVSYAADGRRTATLQLSAPSVAGSYELHYLCCGGYRPLAEPVHVGVGGGAASPPPPPSPAPPPRAPSPSPLSTAPPPPPSSGGECVDVTIAIVPDRYPTEMSWQLANHHDHTVAQGTSSGSTVCVHPGLYEFTALDSHGDGWCCGYGHGGFSLQYHGEVVARGGEFGRVQTVQLDVVAKGTPQTAHVQLKLTPDRYPNEVSWRVTDSSAVTVMQGTEARGDEEELVAGAYTLTLTDSYGDGMCCAYGQGSYELLVDGELVASGGDFGSEVSHQFSVGAASSVRATKPPAARGRGGLARARVPMGTLVAVGAALAVGLAVGSAAGRSLAHHSHEEASKQTRPSQLL